MKRVDWIDKVAGKTGLTKKDSALAVTAALEVIEDALVNGEEVSLSGFGIFKVKERKARTARNPRTGEAVPVPPSRGVSFKPATRLKDLVKGQG